MAETAELIAIGKIEKPFGVRGEVHVRSLSDVPGRFEALGRVTLVAPSGRVLDTMVNRVREHGDSYVLGFEALTTPEEAAAFRGGLIKIPRDQTPPLPAGQYYEFDLVGMQVRSEHGQPLGVLEEVLETESNHVFVVRAGRREILLPATREVIAAVDVQGRTMTVRVVKGLLDDRDH
ncbi:MAG: ribosome maturation factor RimM [Nitrospiraceae bacterium]